MSSKPNCYECKWRCNLAGSAHSCCNHPSNGNIMGDPFAQLLGVSASVGRVLPVKVNTDLQVKGNPHGIAKGWFNWPFNYDPAWLESCDGFQPLEAKEGEEEIVTSEVEKEVYWGNITHNLNKKKKTAQKKER